MVNGIQVYLMSDILEELAVILAIFGGLES
jgi:hypothetical protein